MPPDKSESKIVRRDFDPGAPTGEGQLYQTADGQWWRELSPTDPRIFDPPTCFEVGNVTKDSIKRRY